jgi:hypothetical protein
VVVVVGQRMCWGCSVDTEKLKIKINSLFSMSFLGCGGCSS